MEKINFDFKLMNDKVIQVEATVEGRKVISLSFYDNEEARPYPLVFVNRLDLDMIYQTVDYHIDMREQSRPKSLIQIVYEFFHKGSCK